VKHWERGGEVRRPVRESNVLIEKKMKRDQVARAGKETADKDLIKRRAKKKTQAAVKTIEEEKKKICPGATMPHLRVETEGKGNRRDQKDLSKPP